MSTAGGGDAFVSAIAEAVMQKLEGFAGLTKRLLQIEDAAEYLGMTVGALYHKAGTDIPVVKIDSKRRFDRRDLDRYIDQAPREGV
jgi:hypothetical protein